MNGPQGPSRSRRNRRDRLRRWATRALSAAGFERQPPGKAGITLAIALTSGTALGRASAMATRDSAAFIGAGRAQCHERHLAALAKLALALGHTHSGRSRVVLVPRGAESDLRIGEKEASAGRSNRLSQPKSGCPAKCASCLLEGMSRRSSRLLGCPDSQALAVATEGPCCFTAVPAMVMVAAGSAAFGFGARSWRGPSWRSGNRGRTGGRRRAMRRPGGEIAPAGGDIAHAVALVLERRPISIREVLPAAVLALIGSGRRRRMTVGDARRAGCCRRGACRTCCC